MPSLPQATLCTSVERIDQMIRALITAHSAVIYVTRQVRPFSCALNRPFRVQLWSHKSLRVPLLTSMVGPFGDAIPGPAFSVGVSLVFVRGGVWPMPLTGP